MAEKNNEQQCRVIARSRLANQRRQGQITVLPQNHWILHYLQNEVEYCTTTKRLKNALQETVGKPIVIPTKTVGWQKTTKLVKCHPNDRVIIYLM